MEHCDALHMCAILGGGGLADLLDTHVMHFILRHIAQTQHMDV